jgi:hypothetical protein
MKLADISGIKRGNIRNINSMSLQRTVRTRASNLVKDKNGDLLADSNNILNVEEQLFSVIECA